MKRFLTLDGYHVEVWVYNPYDYSAHVFVANKPGEHVNSGNSKVYHLHGKDAYECLMSDGKGMTKEQIVHGFFS